MFRLMKENNDVPDDDGASDLVLPGRDDARVDFEGVKFSYSGDADGRRILRGVSFSVEPGQKVAIVGSSGAGKSTIGKLLYRLYDVQGGAVLINGQNIAKITQRSVRCAIGIVPQDCVLFNDTIEYNIAFGKLGTSTMGTIEEVKRAAKAAQFSKFVDEQCKDGYQTLVGERGLRLSGGEKQRVAIARALLKDPNHDLRRGHPRWTRTRRRRSLSINEAAKGRTNLVIAHRLSTIMDSDCIIVLKDGEVAERGDHPALYEKSAGLYRTMWTTSCRTRCRRGSPRRTCSRRRATSSVFFEISKKNLHGSKTSGHALQSRTLTPSASDFKLSNRDTRVRRRWGCTRSTSRSWRGTRAYGTKAKSWRRNPPRARPARRGTRSTSRVGTADGTIGRSSRAAI